MRFPISFPRFGVRRKFVVTGLITAGFVWGLVVVDGAKRQSAALTRVSQTYGIPHYRPLVPVPSWCIDCFGPDLFARVTSVSYFEWGAYPAHDPVNYRNYTALRDLPFLEEIDVFDSAFPVEVLEGMPTLQRLSIVQNGLRDDDMEIIAHLHGLRTLTLTTNDITDAGARTLSSLQKLTELDLSGNFVSAETISELQRSLPNCQIRNNSSRIANSP